jgi:hydroxymethylpyrimidine/phosphomethylpyrimidine kinase
MSASPIPCVLSIAGSDSGAGAGIQADLKAFAACGVHGMTAITAVTAQNTAGVQAIHHVPGEMIVAQVLAVLEDIGVDAVKIGMLGRIDTIEAVRYALERLPRSIPVVLDPVMVAESGAVLSEPSARLALVRRILPRATVVTPNLPEAREIARLLAGCQPEEERLPDRASASHSAPGLISDPHGAGEAQKTAQEAEGEAEAEQAERAETVELARSIHGAGASVVVITGGHRRSGGDLFHDGQRTIELTGERHPDGAAHGSGCTHSSVLAARLALGDDPLSAARTARELTARAVKHGLRGIGSGAGPVNVLGVGGGASGPHGEPPR